MIQNMAKYSLYKWRYPIAYLLLVLLVVITVALAGFSLPGGLREAERSASIVSASLGVIQFDEDSVINLPYHILQRGIFELFGMSVLTIKLPSIILSLFTLSGLFFLLKSWFRPNVAIITTVIVTTLPAFLFFAQDGTPTIYALGVAMWLLFAATRVSRQHTPAFAWRLLAFLLLALNLYAPLGIYLNLAVVSTILVHPHIRHVTKRLNINHVAIAGVLALLIMTPLVYSISVNPRIALELLGVPDALPNLFENAKTLALVYFGFYSSGSGPIAQPMFSIGAFLVLIIGTYRFLQIKYTARSYITWFWIIILVPIILINPLYAAYILPLAFLMLAMGIASLFADWYKLFPFNPYARVAGLFPLGLIVTGLVISGASRYVMSYYYSPNISTHFDSDLKLLDETLTARGATQENPASFVPIAQQQKFYSLVADYDARFIATDKPPAEQPALLIISGQNERVSSMKSDPVQIVTDRKSNQSDRLYLYTSDAS
jgi:hypothetical protein